MLFCIGDVDPPNLNLNLHLKLNISIFYCFFLYSSFSDFRFPFFFIPVRQFFPVSGFSGSRESAMENTFEKQNKNGPQTVKKKRKHWKISTQELFFTSLVSLTCSKYYVFWSSWLLCYNPCTRNYYFEFSEKKDEEDENCYWLSAEKSDVIILLLVVFKFTIFNTKYD